VTLSIIFSVVLSIHVLKLMWATIFVKPMPIFASNKWCHVPVCTTWGFSMFKIECNVKLIYAENLMCVMWHHHCHWMCMSPNHLPWDICVQNKMYYEVNQCKYLVHMPCGTIITIGVHCIMPLVTITPSFIYKSHQAVTHHTSSPFMVFCVTNYLKLCNFVTFLLIDLLLLTKVE